MTSPPTQETRRHWDDLAESYDEAKARNAVYFDALKAIIDRSVPQALRGSVLEVGCGTGAILASLSPGRGVGIDLSEKMIVTAGRKYAGALNLSFRVMEASAAGQLGEFDAVISADVLEHVEDWRAVVGAIAAACAPGKGVIVILTPNPLWALPLWILEKLRLKMPEGPHRYVHRKAIARELDLRGCRVFYCGTSLLCPARLLGLGSLISGFAEQTPLLDRLGVIQCVVAGK